MIQIADLRIVALDEELARASTVAQKVSILRLMRDALADRLRVAETATLRECFKDRLTANWIGILELEAAAVDEQQLGHAPADVATLLAEQHAILDECWFLARGSSRTWFSSGNMAHLNHHLPVAPNNVVKAELLYQRLVAAWKPDDDKELFGLSCCCAPWFGWAEADDDDDNAQWTSPSALWSSIVSAWCGASSSAEEDDTPPPPADSVSVGGVSQQNHSSASMRAGLRRRRV